MTQSQSNVSLFNGMHQYLLNQVLLNYYPCHNLEECWSTQPYQDEYVNRSEKDFNSVLLKDKMLTDYFQIMYCLITRFNRSYEVYEVISPNLHLDSPEFRQCLYRYYLQYDKK
jgi:hypothetical protein